MRSRTMGEVLELMQPAPVELVGEEGQVVGPDIVIDNRLATPGALFVAIPGERVDGHSYAPAAVEAGARGVIGMYLTEAEVPHILAEDSVQALSWLARGVVREARARGMISVGVTGSSGKTSTKDLIAQILETVAPTVSPVGSQNNEVGVPLTACRVDDETTYLVSEMGARGIGHIAWLTSLVGLDVGVCLNVGRAHMGEFGGLEVTAKAKSEIVAELSPEGWAVLNADDPWVAGMRATTRAQVAWFGEGPLPEGELGVTARDISLNRLSQASFDLVLTRPGAQARAARVALQVIGRHQVSNALAAAATALAVGLDLEQVASALSAAKPRSDWRMELIRLHSGALVLNDSYNANPDSMAAALTTVGALIDGARGEHPDARAIAVLGDMLELGLGAGDLHEELGRKAAENGVGEVIAVGQFAPQIVAGARSAGIAASIAQREEVVSSLTLVPGDVVLVKGSRGVGLEKVAAELVARDGDAL